ncbi:MAG: UDP-N-acetylglucosamine 1-carboxyvinyltransferase [Chloroflexi bacterium 13_1_40CM_3_70_6]|nr:MAG: UDP-N-acetylglucosamine 1-carboxyvinyltransferase [Chloroflexi bacterium 13_1_40CM_3_70_6]
MARFIVEGGTPLRGEITPAGNKNEALPLIAASLLTEEPVTLRNVPRIRDVRGMLEIASALGAKVEELDARSVRVTGALRSTEVPAALAGEIRTSLLFAGPLLARYKKVKLGLPGGDVIGRRRNDTHFLALRALGAELDASPSGYGLHTAGLVGADVLLDEPSVTATENALMAAVLAKGRTVIRNAASEPHVQQLGMALLRMGARMIGVGTNTITIDGVESLKGIEHTILGDHMEVGSLVGAVAMTHGEVTIKNAVTQHLRMTRLVFKRLGVQTEIRGDDLVVKAGDRYVIEHDIGGAIPKVQSQVWPGFPSDLTSVATAMATQAEGTVLIHEWMYPGRMYWVGSLESMGARLVLCDPHRTVVIGPSQLYGSELRSPDIRAGMALLAATLCAKGTSVINNVEQIDRGYEELDARLRSLGAKIERAA